MIEIEVRLKMNNTVTSALDGWQVEVIGNVDLRVAQWVADRLGASVDYIQPEDVAALTRSALRVGGRQEGSPSNDGLPVLGFDQYRLVLRRGAEWEVLEGAPPIASVVEALGDGWDSVDVEHLEDGLHGPGWYRVRSFEADSPAVVAFEAATGLGYDLGDDLGDAVDHAVGPDGACVCGAVDCKGAR